MRRNLSQPDMIPANEWQLQDYLTLKWINDPLIIEDKEYFLIAWELMFPSWKINDKYTKWNEPSVDFILFDGQQTLLCLELKNKIKARKPLMSAYCQISHRTTLFKEQYNPQKLKEIYDACFDKNDSYRIEKAGFKRHEFIFPEKVIVQPVLAAMHFPADGLGLISEWNGMAEEDFILAIERYVPDKEMKRVTESRKKEKDVVVVKLRIA